MNHLQIAEKNISSRSKERGQALPESMMEPFVALAFNAPIFSVPYRKEFGCAFYWTPPNNLDGTRALLLKHMRDVSALSMPPRISLTNLSGLWKDSPVRAAASFIRSSLITLRQSSKILYPQEPPE
jgi:hypothetical protein